MQHGDIVRLGTGCPVTNTGQHHVEDWCRMCGQGGHLAMEFASLRAEIKRLRRENECYRLLTERLGSRMAVDADGNFHVVPEEAKR